jgi:hypothetical protein
MREIKFRIFDKKYNEYCEEPDFRWSLSRNGKLYNSENDEWHDIGERFIVEFFTGVKDEVQNKIYEGDILLYLGAKGVVFYEEDTAMFLVKFKTNCSNWSFDSMDEPYEIIGNIYQNPELLTTN